MKYHKEWNVYIMVGVFGFLLFCGYWWFAGKISPNPKQAIKQLENKKESITKIEPPKQPTTEEITTKISKLAKIMQKQLENTDRALIEVELKATSPLKFLEGNKEVNCDVCITMTNIGRSVASNINWDVRMRLTNLMVDGDPIGDPIKEQKKIRDRLYKIKTSEIIEGESILPGRQLIIIGNHRCLYCGA